MRALPVSIRKIKNHLNKQSPSDCENLDGKFPKPKVQPRSKRSKKLKFRYLTYVFFLCASLLFQSVMRPVSALQPPSDARGKTLFKKKKLVQKDIILTLKRSGAGNFLIKLQKLAPRDIFLMSKLTAATKILCLKIQRLKNLARKNPAPRNLIQRIRPRIIMMQNLKKTQQIKLRRQKLVYLDISLIKLLIVAIRKS